MAPELRTAKRSPATPLKIALARDRAVEHGIADDDAPLARQRAAARRIDHEAPARQALAGIVVGGALELEGDAAREEGAEALPGGADELHRDGALGQALVAVAPGDLARQHGADGAVDVADRQLDHDALALLERGHRSGDELVIERLAEPVILRLALIGRGAGRHLRSVEHAREVEPPRLRIVDAAHLEPVGAADHLVEGAEAELRHELAHFLGEEMEERDHVLGPAGEAAPQLRILRRDAHRTGVEVALAHHDAALGDEGGGGDAEFVGAEESADHHVAAGSDAAIDLHRDAAAQTIEDQRLVRLGEADLPRLAGVMDRGQRRGAGAAFVPRDGDMVGMGLGDAGRDRADADLGDELDAHQTARIDVLQIVDKLLQILDRIDVVMRRRRNEADAGDRVPHARDPVIDLMARKLAALAGLRPLRHLDLHHVGIDEIFGIDFRTGPRRPA